MSIFIAVVWIAMILVINAALRSRMNPLGYVVFVFVAVIGTMLLLWFTMSWISA